jgi:hypothetical protein
MLLHLPVNHRYRPLYRFLASLAGLYVIVFGIVGAVVSRGHGAFSRGPMEALGLHTNLAFSILSIVVGAVALLGVALGRNLDFYLELFGGAAFLLVGMLMLALLETGLNILNFTVATCVVSFVIGLVLFTAGLYSRTGTTEEVETEEQYRHVAPGAPQPAHPAPPR